MKNLVLFVITFFGLLPLACRESNDDGCDDINYPTKFHITSFLIKQTSLSNGKIDTSKYLPYDSIILALNIKDKVDFAYLDKNKTFTFLNPAYACTPPIQQSIETLYSIEIIAKSKLKTLALSINPGDTITSLFLTKLAYINHFESIQQFINQQMKLRYENPLLFKFTLKPETPSIFAFDLFVTLSDNSLHKFDNQTFKIQ